MNSIRVAMITQRYYPHVGGAERQLAALIPRLQHQGVEVHILTRRYQKNLAPFERVQGVPVHRLSMPGPKAAASLTFTAAALAHLHRLKPHLIHAHELLSPTTTAILAKRLLGTPVVAKVLRGGELGDIHKLQQRLFGRQRLAVFRRHVDTFISISREIDRELAGLDIPASQRRFIPNGVDVERFKPLLPAHRQALRSRLGLAGAPVVLFTGRLEPEKQVQHLVSIWPQVQAAHPGATLLLVGTGSQEGLLKQQAGSGVLFTGPVDDVAPYLQAADLFVLPSATEGLSNALLEALAAGLPAIATSVGGAPDVIDHDRSGWLVPAGHKPALLEAIVTLLADNACRESMGQQGRERVMRDYSLPAVARSLLGLYQQLGQLDSC